jgi:cilia- and flagella-associated protein 251
MKDEVRFSKFAETGEYIEAVDIDTFIRLFVNHRPVYGLGRHNIEEAFAALLGDDKKEGGVMSKDDLYNALL